MRRPLSSQVMVYNTDAHPEQLDQAGEKWEGEGSHREGAPAGPASPTPVVGEPELTVPGIDLLRGGTEPEDTPDLSPDVETRSYDSHTGRAVCEALPARAGRIVDRVAQIAHLFDVPNDLRPDALTSDEVMALEPVMVAEAQLEFAIALLNAVWKHLSPDASPDPTRSFESLANVGRAMREKRHSGQADSETHSSSSDNETQSAAGSPVVLHEDTPPSADLYPLRVIQTTHGKSRKEGLHIDILLPKTSARLQFVDGTNTTHFFYPNEILPEPFNRRLREVGTHDTEAERVARALLRGRWRNRFKVSLTEQVLTFLLNEANQYPTPLSEKQVRAYTRGEQRDAARRGERMRANGNDHNGRDFAAAG